MLSNECPKQSWYRWEQAANVGEMRNSEFGMRNEKCACIGIRQRVAAMRRCRCTKRA